MNRELSLVVSLGNVLDAGRKGRGVSRALVMEFGKPSAQAKAVARSALLGFPVRAALRELEESESEEVSMLASLIISSGKSSARDAGDRGRSMTATLERWLRAKESERMESRVMRSRALIASGVLGAVSAMVATLGPLVSGLSLSLSATPPSSPYFTAVAGLMVAASSTMLGIFMSGRKFLPNLLTSMSVFVLIVLWMSPLAAVGMQPLWGIK